MKSRLVQIEDWERLATESGFNVNKAARLCQVSVRQLERFCQKTFQRSPHVWLRHVQLRTAERLLAEGKSVKETAQHLAFKQTSHFCREFKKATGVTPGDFALLAARARATRRVPASSVALG